MDELPIEVHKAKEGLDLLYLCQIHGNMVLQDDQSKVLNLLLLELTFLWLEKQPLLSEGSEDLADNLLVFGEGAGVDEDVIHVAYYLAIVDELMEDVVHHCLECCGELHSLKNMTVGLNSPQLVQNVAFHLLPSLIHMLLNPQQRLSMVKNPALWRQVRTLETRGSTVKSKCVLISSIVGGFCL